MLPQFFHGFAGASSPLSNLVQYHVTEIQHLYQQRMGKTHLPCLEHPSECFSRDLVDSLRDDSRHFAILCRPERDILVCNKLGSPQSPTNEHAVYCK